LADGAPDASFRLVAEHDARSDASDRGDGAKVTEAAPSAAWSLDRAGATTVNDRVVVLRGDTLWSIAARHLGPQAGAAAIDSEWRRWFALNRQVIGEDADLILPGQLLARPVSSQTSGRTEGAAAPRSGLGAGS
jgi:nucleoid-associated protein YgaU